MNNDDFITIFDIRVAGGAVISKELQGLINSTIFVQVVEDGLTKDFCLRGSVGRVTSFTPAPTT